MRCVIGNSFLFKVFNDNSTNSSALSEKLFSANVLPYYLHLLDLVPGVGHFEVTPAKGQQLIDEIQPGYLVPRLVREEAGEVSKTRIT